MLRLFRPIVPRVTAAHVASHICPCSGPEPRQVGRDRDRPLRRGKQRELQRHPPAGQRGRRKLALKRLRPGGGEGHRLGVVDRGPAARQRQMGGQVAVQAARVFPPQQATQQGEQVQLGRVRQA